MKKLVFIACDTNRISEAKKIISQTHTKKLNIGYKFGLEFFYSKNGRKFISKIKGKKIFLDLKLNDIPATCSNAIMSLRNNLLNLSEDYGTYKYSIDRVYEILKNYDKII